MSKTNTWENQLLLLLFNNEPVTLIGDPVGLLGSSSQGYLYVSLHTADPGEAGDQSTNEVAYTGYMRAAVDRNPFGWTVNGSSVSPTGNIEFPPVTGGAGTVTHFGIGTSLSGAGKLLYKGPLTPNITITAGITPRITTATVITED